MFRRATVLAGRHLGPRGLLARPRPQLLLPAVAQRANQSHMPAPPSSDDEGNRLAGMPLMPFDDVHALPHDFHHLSNELLFHLAKNHVHGACRERLIREIMRVDKLDWQAAYAKVESLNRENDEGAWIVTFPYKIGFVFGVTAAVTALPLVFDLNTVLWFNDHFVHEDLPEGGVESLDNMWKIGAFSWSYMEPLMGTLSFILLGFQFARAQMMKIGARPYTELLLSYRADRLARRYPQYNRYIVKEFSKTDPWQD